MITKYMHHGEEVYVKDRLKGKHKEHCLCHSCKRFFPNIVHNCPIAQRIYDLNQRFGVLTPVWECPFFIERDKVISITISNPWNADD